MVFKKICVAVVYVLVVGFILLVHAGINLEHPLFAKICVGLLAILLFSYIAWRLSERRWGR